MTSRKRAQRRRAARKRSRAMKAGNEARMRVLYGLGHLLPKPKLTPDERQRLDDITEAMGPCIPWRNPVDNVVHFFGMPEWVDHGIPEDVEPLPWDLDIPCIGTPNADSPE